MRSFPHSNTADGSGRLEGMSVYIAFGRMAAAADYKPVQVKCLSKRCRWDVEGLIEVSTKS